MVFVYDETLLSKLQLVEGPSYKKILWVDDKIYGIGGWHRYFVNTGNKYDGFELDEVLFSAFHSGTKGEMKAKEAGFSLFY